MSWDSSDYAMERRLREMAPGLHRRADGHGVQRVRGVDAPYAQRLVEAVPQLGEEGQRTAQIYDVSRDLTTLRKSGNSLIYDSRKYTSGDIFFLCALIKQRLDIRLCENAAS